MASKKWKSSLLSSGLPLEYEAAKALVSRGFVVETDYPYELGGEKAEYKEFTVDMRAIGFPPFSDVEVIDGTLELLIECKHRGRGTRWFFLPDVNRPDFSHMIFGCALRVFDDFSTIVSDMDPSYEFSRTTARCSKGVEVQQAGGLNDTEIRLGIEQLRYALPQLIRNSILRSVMGHLEDNRPFMVCPILLTTAELLVLRKNITIASVEAAVAPSDLGKSVPYLITYSGYGPAFEKHCKSACRILESYTDNEKVREVDHARGDVLGAEYEGRGPIECMKGLAMANCSSLELWFTQFIICTRVAFPKLIEKLKRWSEETLDSPIEVRGIGNGNGQPSVD